MSAYPRTAQEGTFLKPEHIRVPVLPPNAHIESDCRGVASILARVGDKWSVFLISLRGAGPRRFNEIKRMVGGISQRMLTLTLRGLERDGLVSRTVFPTIPPPVHYELTELRVRLLEAVLGLAKGAKTNRTSIHAARERYDGKPPPASGRIQSPRIQAPVKQAPRRESPAQIATPIATRRKSEDLAKASGRR